MASIDRETLVAYVDNELPRESAAEVEKALAADPEAQEIVRLMRLSGEAAAHAFDQAFEEPPPAHLLVALQGAAQMQRSSWNRRVSSFQWRLMLAACLASLAIGFAGGLLERSFDKGYAPAAAKAEDPLATSFESALFSALGSGVAGRGYDYGSDAIGHGRLTLGRDLATSFGSDCREFDRVEIRGSVQSHDGGLACQSPGGGWTVMTIPQ
jgi:hypothetical protein